MTKEEKQILLIDLCARSPYGVKFTLSGNNIYTMKGIDLIVTDEGDWECAVTAKGIEPIEIEYIKPYLRPMSSMTEDEREEIEVFIFNEWYQENSCKIDKEGWIEILANYDVSGIDPCFCSDYIDWLNAHHFDYRGLIEKSLAIVAPGDMYKNK